MPRGQPPPPPEFLVDRSLGLQVAEAIAKLDYTVHTLRSIYGVVGEQDVKDEVWVAAAAAAGQLILTKDDIRRDQLAYRAFVDGGAKVFFLPNRSLSAEEMSARYLGNLNRIIQRGLKLGPLMYSVQSGGLLRLYPPP